MTRERFLRLYDLADEVNRKVDASVSVRHSRFSDDIFISLFYSNEVISFYEDGYINPDLNMHEDPDFTKAEAFMRMLLESAKHCKEMRGEDD